MDTIIAEGLNTVISFVVPLVEACGALVIIFEVGRTIVRYVGTILKRSTFNATVLRIRLGQSMVMGLEFQVAADILKTALAPTWNDILLLAALIALRTVLNYLLERELKMLSNGAMGQGEEIAEPAARQILS